jgi:hypothetical protein
VLNQVFNPQSISLTGRVISNGRVLFMGNAIVSGAGMNLDIAGMVDTSLRLPRSATAAGGAARAAQTRPLATLDGGRIHVTGKDAQAVTAAGGDWVLGPGRSIELANAAMPNLRVELTAPPSAAINLSRLVAGKGESGIFAGLFRVPASARQAVERGADVLMTAVMEDRVSDAPGVDRFLRYASLYAEPRGDAVQFAGGMANAPAPERKMIIAAARSRPSLLPRDIEIGASVAERPREPAATLAAAPISPLQEPVATLEPQPVPVAFESESERDGVPLLARYAFPVRDEVVATLEPQPVPVAFESESERNGVPLLARTAVPVRAEVMATLEPQPILARQVSEPEDVRMLAGQVPALAALAPPERAQVAALESDPGRGRRQRRAGETVIVVARAQQSGMPAAEEGSDLKEVRIERRAPRYFTDYRGGIFFM